jgi:MoxR-like ATPase
MALPRDQKEMLLSLVNQRYPDWAGFDDPRFVHDEIDYKHSSVEHARALLSESALRELFAAGNYGEIVNRLETIGRDNNLLWHRVPQHGDLGILYQSGFNKPTFCEVLIDLLYGPGASPERLGRYVDYVADADLPNKWTFPTYFLFVCHPETDMVIKPNSYRWFIDFSGLPHTYRGTPTATAYAAFKDKCEQIKRAFAKYAPHDMVDIQSLIWVCCQQAEQRRLAEPKVAYEVHTQPVHTLEQCAEETGFEQSDLERMARALDRKRQVILYGPPGTGKTYLAEHLARHVVGGEDGFWEIVQFHPAYAYEDFVQGIRPQRVEGGLDYPMQPGRFVDFCERARTRTGRCVLIIDEINRADLARVFGELMYLLEYRERSAPLAGGGTLNIPDNVYLIGTMNTADRSIALVDHALRRRFAFIALRPNYDALRHFHQRSHFAVEGLIEVLQRLNRAIDDAHYEVGLSFFMRDDLVEHVADIWRMEIEPYLEEYFFDRAERVDEFRWDRIAAHVLGS